jgi:glycerol-3-phosphate cytidylyltransferase-like family protein
MNKSDNLSISSPPKTKKKQHGAGPSSRLYRAPQSNIRRIDAETVVTASDKHCNARRRRQHGVHNSKSRLMSPSPTTGSNRRGSTSKNKKTASRHRLDYNSSDESSTNSVLESIEAPCLWMDDVEGNLTAVDFNVSQHTRTRQSRHRKRRNIKFSSADSVMSEQHNCDEESVYTHHTTHSMYEVPSVNSAAVEQNDDHCSHNSGKRKLELYQPRWDRYWNLSSKDGKKNRHSRFLLMAQAAIALAFIVVMWDSRRRVRHHKQQVQRYDEERAHILEQMTWIDNAAKKVHKKYAGFDSLLLSAQKNGKLSDPAQLEESKFLQAQLEQLQLRVQQNARDRTVRQFGDNPVQVSLPVTEGDVTGEHIVIALSDDTPHAASVLLQQLANGLWDQVDFQRLENGRVLQASPRFSSTTPVLEFVEKSRGCHHAGSVAVHQLESDDFHVLVLKIHMEETAAIDEGDVCIGTVLSGLETLEQIIPQIPVIRSQD